MTLFAYALSFAQSLALTGQRDEGAAPRVHSRPTAGFPVAADNKTRACLGLP